MIWTNDSQKTKFEEEAESIRLENVRLANEIKALE